MEDGSEGVVVKDTEGNLVCARNRRAKPPRNNRMKKGELIDRLATVSGRK